MRSEIRSVYICARTATSSVVIAALGAALAGCGATRSTSTGAQTPPLPSTTKSAPHRSAPTFSTTETLTPLDSSVPSRSTDALPEAVAEVAARFTTLWASHDARPGRDEAHTDASKRAAKYASADLGASLSAARPGTTRQWQEWTKRQATVTATVTKVSVPDGAPAPTSTSALARVLYRLTVTPARGKAISTMEQVALQLERDTSGQWRVVALPYA